MLEGSERRGSFLLRRDRAINTYPVCGNAAVAECWDIDYRSLVSCKFLQGG